VFNRYPRSDTTLPARYARALGSFFRGDLASASPQIDALIRQQPQYPYFWELKGELLLRASQPAQAIAPLRRALKLTDNAPLIATRLSQALLSTNDGRYLNEAVTLLRTAVRVDPDATGFRLLASAYYKKRRFALALLYQAEAHLIGGRIKEARRFAKRALLKLKKGTTSWLRADDIVKIRS
jgi:predicted Zn-dependent protease